MISQLKSNSKLRINFVLCSLYLSLFLWNIYLYSTSKGKLPPNEFLVMCVKKKILIHKKLYKVCIVNYVKGIAKKDKILLI